MVVDEKVIRRFWSKVQKGSLEACWIWQGCGEKYGTLRVGKRMEYAHRVSWVIHYGNLKGLNVLHNCPEGDNTRCVNPNHLWLGTAVDNNRDRMEKGRQPRGEGHANSVLTWEEVREIRRLYETGEYTFRQLAARFGTNASNACKIVKNKAWRLDAAICKTHEGGTLFYT